MRRWLTLLTAAVTALVLSACGGEGVQGTGVAVRPHDANGSYYGLTHAWTHCYNYRASLPSNCMSDLTSQAEAYGGGKPWLRQNTVWTSWDCAKCTDPNLVANAGAALRAGDNVVVTVTGLNTDLPRRSEYAHAAVHLIRTLDRTSYTGKLAIESWNEPDCNCGNAGIESGINSFRAAQYFQDLQEGIRRVRGRLRNVIPVAGAFVTSIDGTKTAVCDDKAARPGSSHYINSYACYLRNHGVRGITNWSFHDYADTETSGCNTDGSWRGCRAGALARFHSTIKDTGEDRDPKLYITETGCVYWPPGASDCANGEASLPQSASGGEEFKYLSRFVAVIIWYTVAYDGNQAWDSAMLNSDGSGRPEWCVLDGYTYSEAISSPHCTVSSANGRGGFGV